MLILYSRGPTRSMRLSFRCSKYETGLCSSTIAWYFGGRKKNIIFNYSTSQFILLGSTNEPRVHPSHLTRPRPHDVQANLLYTVKYSSFGYHLKGVVYYSLVYFDLGWCPIDPHNYIWWTCCTNLTNVGISVRIVTGIIIRVQQIILGSCYQGFQTVQKFQVILFFSWFFFYQICICYWVCDSSFMS